MGKKRRHARAEADRPVVAPRPEPSRARRWLFRAVLVTLPWIFFGALELGLRAAGYGASMDFALRRRVGGETRHLSNPRFTWLFFPPNMARLVPPFSLPLHKPQGTCRVFVLGSSAAQGDPEPGFGLARMLEVELQDQYPGVDFEVINAATAAINSHVVYRMARAALDLEPDLFVVYAGNNEVIGPYGAASTSPASAQSLALLRAGIALKGLRLGQLLAAATAGIARLAGRADGSVEWRGMETFTERQVRLSDPALERTYASYARNLTDICVSAGQAGVPVVLSTLSVNLRRCAPFGSRNRATLSKDDGERWSTLYRDGVRLAEANDCAAAAARFREAAGIDDSYAELAYRQAQCDARLGRSEDAGRSFQRALALDTLRFRADARINEIVRLVASRHAGRGVRLVDAEQALAARSPHGLTGEELFLDHVHFTFTGNYQLSLALFGEVSAALPEWVRAKASGRPLLSEPGVAKRLVFTELDHYMIAETMHKRLQQPPFTAQLDHGAQVERFSQEMAALRARSSQGAVDAALREYEQALAEPHPHWSIRERYAAIQRRIGNSGAAQREWRVLADQFPQYPAYSLQLARGLREAGQYADAEKALKAMAAYQPESSLALAELAKVALLEGRNADAVRDARRAVAFDARDADARHVLASSLCRHDICESTQRAEAVEQLGKALTLAPDSAPVRRDLARLLLTQTQRQERTGDDTATIALLERALEAQADLVDAHEALGLLYAERREVEKARRHLRAALVADPSRTRARDTLSALPER